MHPIGGTLEVLDWMVPSHTYVHNMADHCQISVSSVGSFTLLVLLWWRFRQGSVCVCRRRCGGGMSGWKVILELNIDVHVGL